MAARKLVRGYGKGAGGVHTAMELRQMEQSWDVIEFAEDAMFRSRLWAVTLQLISISQ